MSKYILNKNKQDSESGENYEVHNVETCEHLPKIENRILLGDFSNCGDAMKKARSMYPSQSNDIDGCYYCCHSCHRE